MPCRNGTPSRAEFFKPVEIGCRFEHGGGPVVTFSTTSPDLMPMLLKMRPVDGTNQLELVAQVALVKQAISRRRRIMLNDDHCSRTSLVFMALFHHGKAEVWAAWRKFTIADVIKEHARWPQDYGGGVERLLFRNFEQHMLYKVKRREDLMLPTLSSLVM